MREKISPQEEIRVSTPSNDHEEDEDGTFLWPLAGDVK